MKLLLTKNMGLLKSGQTFYSRTDEQGQELIEKGIAKEHPEPDDESETELVLYEDEEGNWKTQNVKVGERPIGEKQPSENEASVNNLTYGTDSIKVETKATPAPKAKKGKQS